MRVGGGNRPGVADRQTGKQSFNVEVTGAARLYRAASVWTAGLALCMMKKQQNSLVDIDKPSPTRRIVWCELMHRS